LFEHLGGYGPWIEKVDEQGVLADLAPPKECSIDQVHLVWTFIFRDSRVYHDMYN